MGNALDIYPGVSLGRVSRRVTDGEFLLTESTHGAGQVLPLHAHRAVNLTLVIRGSFLERWESGVAHCEPGTVLFKHACQPHSNRYGDDGADVLHLEPTEPSSLAARSLATLFEGPTRRRVELSEPLLQIVRERTRHDSPRRLLETLLARPKGALEAPDWLSGIRLRILQTTDSRLSLRDLAADFGVSRVRLSRSFRACFGCSVGEYIRRSRIERAAQLLVASRMSQSEIACVCGFADQAHLCRLFVRRMGRTPGRYREAYRSVKKATRSGRLG